MTSMTKSRAQKSPFTRNTLRELRSPGLFAKLPAVGITMFVFGSLLFGILAYSLKNIASVLQWDMLTASTFRQAQVNAPWSLMENILFGIFIGKEVVFLTGMILIVYFLHKRFWRELAMVVVGLGGGALIWMMLTRYFDRPRPTDHLDVLQISGASFPSGPALMSLLGYGLLAYFLIPNLSSRIWKWCIALLCILAIGVVALSSLLFGTHYATDVIAGYSLAIAWAGLVLTLIERFFPGERFAGRERSGTETISQGLRVPGLFDRRPLIDLTLILLGSLSFALLGYGVLADGPLVQLDLSVYKELLTQAKAASPTMNDVMLFGFFLGKQAIQLTVMILSLYFLYQRYWLEFAMIQIAIQGGGFLKNLVIDYFARPRPPEQLGLVITTLPSFPSGHAMGTIICYGFLAYLLVPRMPSPFWKWTLGIAMLCLVLFEGFSRIFHGNHYLTDVLAGYALGLTWLVLVCLLMERMFLRSRGNRK